VDSGVYSSVDFTTEVVEKGGGVVGRMNEVTHGADIFALDVTEDNAGLVIGDGTVEIIGRAGAGEVEDGGSCFEASAGNLRVIGFDGDESTLLSEGLKNRKKSGDLLCWVHTGGVMEGGFGSEIDQVCSFRAEATAPGDGSLGIRNDTFAVPGVGAEVDDAHKVRAIRGTEGVATNFKFGDLSRQG
jgi:hypothetical protein